MRIKKKKSFQDVKERKIFLEIYGKRSDVLNPYVFPFTSVVEVELINTNSGIRMQYPRIFRLKDDAILMTDTVYDLKIILPH